MEYGAYIRSPQSLYQMAHGDPCSEPRTRIGWGPYMGFAPLQLYSYGALH